MVLRSSFFNVETKKQYMWYGGGCYSVTNQGGAWVVFDVSLFRAVHVALEVA